MRRAALILCASACLCGVLPGCVSEESPAEPGAQAPEVAHAELLPNLKVWSERLLQGGEPAGEEAYAELAKRGVSLVLSVDGLEPPAELAARHGIRVAHVPIGYDGIARDEALQILKAYEGAAPGKLYVHCHHGHHRGPAAMALVRITFEGVDNLAAERDLADSGCSPKYAGLYAAVRTFRVPTKAELAAAPAPAERVAPRGVKGAMVDLDRFWGPLVAAKRAGWERSAEHPDVDPRHHATIVRESLRELARTPESEPFRALAREAEAEAKSLEDALRGGDGAGADAAYARLVQRCDACHVDHRN